MDTATRTPAEVIDDVLAARAAEQGAAVRQLQLALEWAHLHPCPAGEWPAHWGDPTLGEQVVPLAGPGAPLVAEFAPADLGAALGVSVDVARQLIADALELGHRLPRLWDLVIAGRVPAWRARLIARETTDLCPDAVAFADRLLCAVPDRIGKVDAVRLVAEARLHFDPDRAIAEEEEALARRGVWLRHGGAPATTEVLMTLDTPDALLLDQTVGRLAADLRDLGDPASLDVRRARAVGILADPQHALDLMSGRERATPSTGAGSLDLYVHLTPADLEPGTGACTIERLGAATIELLGDWLARQATTGGRVVIRPVLELERLEPVDQHDPPTSMREAVLLRDAHCVFPGCRCDSRACDLDHINPYVPLADGGPPGQTSLANLAPLCRTHHRVKTFTGWDYKRLDGGGYAWTSPTGHQYDVASASRRPPDRRRRT